MVPYLAPFSGDAGAAAVCKEFHAACFQEAQAREMAPVEEEEGEDLCNCEFSLAYGGKILLNNARLHLKRGQRYGLCGPNGAGKSTLMRAIGELFKGRGWGAPPRCAQCCCSVNLNAKACRMRACSTVAQCTRQPVQHLLTLPLARHVSPAANGQLDGFPPKSELRTVYVEHDIDASGEAAAGLGLWCWWKVPCALPPVAGPSCLAR